MIGFIEFIRTQGVVGLAIGVILGAAVARTVTALVEDIINPIIGILLGKAGDLNEMSTTVRGVEFLWGDLLSNLINLIVIAAVVYYGVKLLRLDKLDHKKEVL
jgi:large conductance mechanosensitive channel